ncbi:MAG: hypothetical protein ABSA76_08995 [Bacteroidales bacterium]
MKAKISLVISGTLFLLNSFIASSQVNISRLPWKYVATQMPDEWYGSDESVRVAENVPLYQRDIGGWPKNLPLHKPLTDPEKATIKDEKGINDAIFDNDAAKTRMLLGNDNPFMSAYRVDVAVETVKGKPVLYKILNMHERIEMPPQINMDFKIYPPGLPPP